MITVNHRNYTLRTRPVVGVCLDGCAPEYLEAAADVMPNLQAIWNQGHQHWPIDIAYLNICATFYYLCSLLDGYSRSVVHWEIRERMLEMEVEVIIQRAREKFPKPDPGSFQTVDRSLWPRTLRSSSGCVA